MYKNPKSAIFLVLNVVLITLSSCGPKTIYQENKTIDENLWTKEKPLVFEFDVKDTLTKYDIVLGVKYKEDFKYINQYISVNTTFPNKKKIEDIVSLELTKTNGETNGKCSGSTCTVPILFQEKITFPLLGKYTIEIGQYSRMDTIQGIQSMEFKLVESAVKKS
jgi:gliding motility-associated lipoprotein GldH